MTPLDVTLNLSKLKLTGIVISVFIYEDPHLEFKGLYYKSTALNSHVFNIYSEPVGINKKVSYESK
jgi:hypothetical protein